MPLRIGKTLSSLLCAFCLLISFSSQASAVVTPLNDDTEFVKQVYLDFLNRVPEAEGLTYWVGQLDAGAFDRSELVEQYLNSNEFGVTVSPVVRLYFTYYQRVPDYEGLMFWVNSYSAGMSLNDVSDAFATAQEFIDRYGSLTNEEFISKMYVNVYGRQPDSGGLAYWTNILDAATLTRGQVMVEFSTAEEYLALSANQVYVTMTYMGLLRRAPEQGGFEYWAGVMDLGVSGLGLIDDFLASEEYAARFDVNVDDDGDGYTENQGDCSDLDINTYPGATEICGDNIDQDCSGVDLLCFDYTDDDGDGYTENQGDCNDSIASINPGAIDRCGDGIDQDCSGSDALCSIDSAEGFYEGSTNTGKHATGIVLDDGTFYFLYSTSWSPYVVGGVVQGDSSANGGVISSKNAKDFNLEGNGVLSAVISGTYSTKQSLSGTISYQNSDNVSFSGTYNPYYEVTPSLATVTGTYSGEVAFSLGYENATMAISPTGKISGVGDSGCTITGAIAPRANGNVYNVSVTFGGRPCYFTNQTMTGIAYYDSSAKNLIAATPNATRTDGVLFVGNKR